MKLWNDFGVRALLAVLAGLGFYGALFFVFVKVTVDLPTTIALIGLANGPWMMAMGFYFGIKVGQHMKPGGE